MVNCYLIQVMTGKEQYFIKHAKRSAEIQQLLCKLIVPRREMTIRRRGKHFKQIKPIFPGYVFWETDDPVPEVRQMLRRQPGFVRLIKDRQGSMLPLTNEDRMIISNLTSDGEIARRSLVFFDEKNRVRILKGPLKGNEGYITKVDRRKQRVTVELQVYEKRFKIAFEYEEVEKRSEPHNKSNKTKKRTSVRS
ncbi:MAG: antiterminator LoaP [Spirochaetota bacterium]